jgi:hypothetical protein
MREDFRFGRDDPLLHPQPLIIGFEHFALIHLPSTSTDHPLALMWLQLNDSHFHHTTQDLFVSSVCLDQHIRRDFLRLTGELVNNIEGYDPAAGLTKDTTLLSLIYKVVEAFARTRHPGTRRSVTMRFALAQRRYLELQARFEWLVTYRPRLQDKWREVTTPGESLVGVLVDDVSQMHLFHRAGIPVWLHTPQESIACHISTPLPFPSYGSGEEPVVPMRGSSSLLVAFSSYCPEPIFRGSPKAPERHDSIYDFLKGTLKGSLWTPMPAFQADRIAPKLRAMLSPPGTGSVIRVNVSRASGSRGRATGPCE